MKGGSLLALLLVFRPLSLTTVGCGQGIISEIHRQAVSQHGWLTERQFIYDFALSRLAPGPGPLLVALIGWDVAGVPGGAGGRHRQLPAVLNTKANRYMAHLHLGLDVIGASNASLIRGGGMLASRLAGQGAAQATARNHEV